MNSKLLAMTMLVFLPNIAFSAPIPPESQNAAQKILEVENQSMGSPQQIKDFASNPLMGGSSMKTMDGKKSFDFKVQCKGSNQFLHMLVQPTGNGNVNIHTIRQDTTMDGKYDTVNKLNMPASGICSNGFIHCSNPKTGEGCNSYKWAANDDNQVNIVRVPLTDLGGCYCISKSCGSNLAWNNLDLILKDLAMGASSALSAKNPFFTVSNMKVDQVTIELSGTDSGTCDVNTSKMPSGKTVQDYTRYKDNSSRLHQDGFAESNGNEWYNNVSNVDDKDAHSMARCSIRRDFEVDRVVLEDIISLDSGGTSHGGVYKLDDENARIVLGRIGDDYWKAKSCTHFSHQTSFYIKRPELIKSATLKYAKFDDWLQVSVNGKYIWDGGHTGKWTNVRGAFQSGMSCEQGRSWQMNPNKEFKSVFDKEGKYRFLVRVYVEGGGEGYVLGNLKVEPKCDITDVFADGCGYLRENDDCELFEEKVDDVYTYRNGMSTGLFPIPSYRKSDGVNGVLCKKKNYRDWWVRERTYRCKSKPNTSWDEGFKRVTHVKKTLTDDGDFNDRLTGKGGDVTFPDGSVNMFDMNAKKCVKSCKVRKEKQSSDIALDGTTDSKRKDEVSYDYFYHDCLENDICPSAPDEEVVKACGCLNEFSEATAAMQVLRMAGEDMICSDGTRGKLDDETK